MSESNFVLLAIVLSVCVGPIIGSIKNCQPSQLLAAATVFPTIIVGMGTVGVALAKFLIQLGFNPICFDIVSANEREKIAQKNNLGQIHDVSDLAKFASAASVVFIATPIGKVSKIILILIDVMRYDSLIVSLASVALPKSLNEAIRDAMKQKGITFLHLHLMFKPEIPLDFFLWGKNITLAIEGIGAEKWLLWTKNLLMPFGPNIEVINFIKHDLITSISQLPHFIFTVLIAGLWVAMLQSIVQAGIRLGGPPCKFLVMCVFRTMKQPPVIAEILRTHPRALEIIRIFKSWLDKLEHAILTNNMAPIIQVLNDAQGKIEKEVGIEIDTITNMHIQQISDFDKPRITLDFPESMNKPGLLARIVRRFDRQNIDKTSTYAHKLPGGGCRFTIGFKDATDKVREIEARIRKSIKKQK